MDNLIIENKNRQWLYILTVYSQKKALFRRRRTAKVAYATYSKKVHLEGNIFVDHLEDGRTFSMTEVKAIKCVGFMDSVERADKPIEGCLIRIGRE